MTERVRVECAHSARLGRVPSLYLPRSTSGTARIPHVPTTFLSQRPHCASERRGDWIEQLLLLWPRADHQDPARAIAGSDEDVFRPSGTVDEIPLLERPLLAFHEQEALAEKHEEVLLRIFAVVHAVGLAGARAPAR